MVSESPCVTIVSSSRGANHVGEFNKRMVDDGNNNCGSTRKDLWMIYDPPRMNRYNSLGHVVKKWKGLRLMFSIRTYGDGAVQ